MADDLGEKTEDATPRRREKARKSGNVARSQDLSGAIILLGATLLLFVILMPTLGKFKVVLETLLDGDTFGNPLDPADVKIVVAYAGNAAVRIGAPILLVMWLVAYLANFGQIGWLLAPDSVKPSLSKLNPISGFKKLFSMSSVVKAGFDILKVAVVMSVAVWTISQHRNEILVMPHLTAMQGLHQAGWMMLDLALRVVTVLILLGLLDFAYQRWKHQQDLKMTKQQVKDEMKQTEGDPAVKKRRLRMQQQIAMQRIAAAVPKADVVVTNPDHYAVAIRYHADEMHAPKVVAKGADILALRIRQIALLRGIPVLQRPPLARALYRQVGVGQEIPPEFYKTVAEVLAFVYGLTNSRMAG